MLKFNRQIFKRAARLLVYIIGGYLSAVLVLGVIYMAVPPISVLMISQLASGERIKQESVELKNVNRNIIKAVLSGEDDRFCQHWGVDWNTMGAVIHRARSGKRTLGASTISMQVAKNLFLWPQRSYIRKMMEIPIAMYLDLLWSKKHMLEVYLSIAEWGDGIYGIEVASKKYFHKQPDSLSPWEAAQLAATLPNPHDRDPNNPERYQNHYADIILKRMNSGVDTSCLK